MLYVFDTNSFSVLQNYYPSTFLTFWTKFNAAVASGRIISVRESLRELESWNTKKHMEDWIKTNRTIFAIPTDEETEFVAQIFVVPHFHQLVSKASQLQGKPVADPFVIAAAKVKKGTVVTEEVMKPHAARIPNVCEHFAVPWTNIEDFMEREGWKF